MICHDDYDDCDDYNGHDDYDDHDYDDDYYGHNDYDVAAMKIFLKKCVAAI